MKNQFFVLLTVAAMVATITGCNKEESDPKIPESFPRKQLIEHFTGQDCGFCPYGMDLISEAIKGNETGYVWISNHAGYADDDYTIAESKKLVSKFGVNSAPAIMLNRETWEYEDENGAAQKGKVVHPYFLQNYTSQVKKTADASVEISNEYDAATRTLNITVSGQAVDMNVLYSLTVALKESGLHGAQADYYNTWEGWEDFVHTNVVRAYLTDFAGDPIGFKKNAYSVTYSIVLDKAWIADNCSVIAFLTQDATGEVINAEEAPVVSGTKGGQDQEHKGITKVAVPDTYPEYSAVPTQAADMTYNGAGFYYAGRFSDGTNVVALQMTSNSAFQSQGYTLLPVAIIYIVVEGDGTTLPIGTFEFKQTPTKGAAWAGFRDEANYQLQGSSFYLAISDYLQLGYLFGMQWMMSNGSITIAENSISYDVTTLIGSNIKGSYSGAIQNYNQASASKRIQQIKPSTFNQPKLMRCLSK